MNVSKQHRNVRCTRVGQEAHIQILERNMGYSAAHTGVWKRDSARSERRASKQAIKADRR
jgi:hypothetical protein